MGFFDNLKNAMRDGAAAANAYIEREKAKEQAGTLKPGAKMPPSGAACPQAGAAAGASRPAGAKSNLPEGVFRISLMDWEPVSLGVEKDGKEVLVNVRGIVRAKAAEASAPDEASQRAEVQKIIRDCLERDLPLKISDVTDLKSYLMAANSMNPAILAELKSKGYQAMFEMPLVIRPL